MTKLGARFARPQPPDRFNKQATSDFPYELGDAQIMPNEIRFNPPSDQLLRGQTVKVPILISVDKAIKFRGINSRFHGAERTTATYTTTSTDSKGRTTTHTHTAVELVEICDAKHLLAGQEPPGFIASVGSAVVTLFGGGQHEVLEPGEYPYEIEIAVPADAPHSHEGKNSRVFYELSAWVDIPAGRDLKATHLFQVAPLPIENLELQPVRVQYPDDQGRGFWNSLFAPDVRIELGLAADRVRLGDVIEGIIKIETPKPLTVRAIQALLVGLETSRAQGHSDSHWHRSEPVLLASPESITDSFVLPFTFTAQSNGPPTARGRLFSLDWFVEIQFDVPWARDPSIRAPLVLMPAT